LNKSKILQDEMFKFKMCPPQWFPLRPPPSGLKAIMHHRNDSITRPIAGCFRFFTFTQCFDLRVIRHTPSPSRSSRSR
jgi:hypothetical protein